MPTRERLSYLGTRRGERLVREFADEIRNARLAASLSQGAVGAAAGVSAPMMSRFERGIPPLPDFVVAARVAQVVGLDLTLKCYPAGGPLRDAAHIALIRRFLSRIPNDVPRLLEAPIAQRNDLRAWDVLLRLDGARIGVAAETRLRDLQALLRRERAKARDDSVDRLILLVAATKANRRALREAWPVLLADLPLDTRAVLAALRRGEDPGGGGVVLA